MYPNLYYFFREVFGVRLSFLRFINSFGFFVALAFLFAAWILATELRRKTRMGLFQPTELKITVGKPATVSELSLNFFLGFILGYKIVALFFLSSEATQDPQAYIFSGMGSLPVGIGIGLLFAGLKWWEKRKRQLAKPEERMVRIWPQDRVGEITIIALLLGLLGAKLFDIFENWNGFLKEPSSYIFSGGGLTFYGGLICATIAIIIYARKYKIGVKHLADAIAPSLMIAYAIGRIGCQVAGDGDWGIYNSAYKVLPDSHISVAKPNEFRDTVQAHPEYFMLGQNLGHASFQKPSGFSFLPDWMFAYNYPHNVNEAGFKIPGCTEKYCYQLPIPVFPTPFYETFICTLLFMLLWALRKILILPGQLFCIYLILNGIERFFIEKIRVNNRMDLFGIHPTQAEVISTGLVIAGAVLWLYLYQRSKTSTEKL